ncbi:hypothetical protein KM427_01060 [Nocardioides sp. LMS-CY]|uniref:hypothetical protein n=1 Tax=Nocardioides sp. (strain LMS-CY) TaxID=2840457 RepID=UPI001C005E99|nr:hypothetical protein [Nocardioides sp. LMS-CY]QWF22376.1 hypothetical protein KM427_01060 [Nocardioides sp. LMS-CY]
MTPPADRSRVIWGVLAGLAALAVLAFPITGVGVLAIASFTGCFIECGETYPWRGVMWTVAGALMLAVPFLVGGLVARVRLRRLWPWAIVPTLVLAAAAAFAQRAI